METNVTNNSIRPTIRFLYASNEREKDIGISNITQLLNVALTCSGSPSCLQPSVHLNNHRGGTGISPQRMLNNGSWLQYTKKGASQPTQVLFTVPEVTRSTLFGAFGTWKYYISDLDSLPTQSDVIVWDEDEYKLHLEVAFEDMDTELKGYYYTPVLEVEDDSKAPDVDLTGPLLVEADLVPTYDYWSGRVSFAVVSTAFQSSSIQADGICDLLDLCDVALDYKEKIAQTVRDATASGLSQQVEVIADFMEGRINMTPPTSDLDGAFVTGMRKLNGDLRVTWVATHLDPGPEQPHGQARPHLISCSSAKTCCEPAPEGGCLGMCISKKQNCP